MASVILAGTAIFGCSPNTALPDDHAPLRIAVATNFQSTFENLSTLFEQQSKSITLSPSYGSSGLLYTQIINGAPFDVFLSADAQRAQNLHLWQQQKQVGHSRIYTYAYGQLVLWAPNEVHPDLAWLSQYKGNIAMANPALAPYGQAAKACMEKMQVISEQHQLIMGSSVAQAFHFIASGAASVGIIAKSQVLDFAVDPEHYWHLPQDCYPPIKQQLVALVSTDDERNAQIDIFLTFLSSQQAQQLIEKAGYLPGHTGA